MSARGGTQGRRTISPDGGAQIGPVEGSMVPDLYTFSYEIQRKPIRNIRISEPERALRSQVGAPGGSCSERYRATFSLSFGGAIQISSYVSPILSEKLTKSYNEIYTFREIENAHISLGVFKQSKIALPPSMAFTFFCASRPRWRSPFQLFQPLLCQNAISAPQIVSRLRSCVWRLVLDGCALVFDF